MEGPKSGGLLIYCDQTIDKKLCLLLLRDKTFSFLTSSDLGDKNDDIFNAFSHQIQVLYKVKGASDKPFI